MMVTTRRLVACALAGCLLAVTAPAGGAPGTPDPVSGRARPTIEPTLPLILEVRFEGIVRAAGGTSARLVVETSAADPIRDLVLEAILPGGLRPAATEWLPRGPLRLARGEVRRFTVPVIADGAGGHPVRIEASFRDPQGRSLVLGQGVTLETATAGGRSHLGAFEVMAVPIEELRR